MSATTSSAPSVSVLSDSRGTLRCRARVLPGFSLILLSQVLSLSNAYGDVVIEEGLCKSSEYIDIGKRGTVLGGFYFDRDCFLSAKDNDGLISGISLRLNYRKSADGVYIYNDPLPSDASLYVNIIPTLKISVVEYEIEKFLGNKRLGRFGSQDIYDAGKMSTYDFYLFDPEDRSYYAWCVTGGSCGRVEMFNKNLAFEVLMPDREVSALPEVASEVAVFLKKSAR